MADFTFSVPDEVVGVVPKLDENDQQIVEAAVDPQIDDQIETEATPVIVESEQTSSVEPTYKTIVVGHGSFEIDSRATPEQIEAARFDYINNDINFYSGLDRQSGASWSATKAVGDALKPEDKLATLRKFYPDAMPFGEDNFVFTNDETGQVTLYNAPGFTLKDIARFTREGSIAVGSTLGGVFGAGGGLVVGSPTGPGALGTAAMGGTAGAIWGGAQTASVYDFLSQAFGETVRSESLMARTGENLMQGLYAGAGESVGRVAIPAAISSVKKALGGGTAKSQIIYDTRSEEHTSELQSRL